MNNECVQPTCVYLFSRRWVFILNGVWRYQIIWPGSFPPVDPGLGSLRRKTLSVLATWSASTPASWLTPSSMQKTKEPLTKMVWHTLYPSNTCLDATPTITAASQTFNFVDAGYRTGNRIIIHSDGSQLGDWAIKPSRQSTGLVAFRHRQVNSSRQQFRHCRPSVGR